MGPETVLIILHTSANIDMEFSSIYPSLVLDSQTFEASVHSNAYIYDQSKINLFIYGLVFFIIMKTYLYYVDPLKPHFYIVKLGFTGVYIIFLISAQNIEFGYSLEPPRF